MWTKVTDVQCGTAGASMSLSSLTVCLHVFVLTCIVSTVPGVQMLTITPDRGSTISISSTRVGVCKVCIGVGHLRRCDVSLLLKANAPISMEFECSRPQDEFRVEISRIIECSTKSCNSHIVQTDSGSLPLLNFNRKFTWNVQATPPKAFKIDFTETGLTQINPAERCPDRHSYTLQAFQKTGPAAIGKYCRKGAIRSAQILNLGSFSLEVPAGEKLQKGQFDVSVGEEIKSLAKITLTLPQGTSTSSELLSPNYPDSFPDDDVMEWSFHVPDRHETTLRFQNLTQPTCLKKDTAVEYHSKGSRASVRRLTEPQLEQMSGDFSMTLRNCEMDRRRAGSPGLRLSIQLSTSRTSSSVLCKVDLSKAEGLLLYIEKLRPAAACEMKLNSVRKDKITVTSNSDLSFQDCLPEDVQVTAMRVIECRHHLKDCPKTPVRLSLPMLPSCLPAPLSSITWILRPPTHGTVELTAPTGPLKQSLPGQPCNDSIIISVAEEDGAPIGHFCPQGAIQKIQIHTNMSVTVSRMGNNSLRTSYRNVLDACFKEEISERYIFTVASKKDKPVLLATPGWPVGMKYPSTVSWIVSVPPKMEAHLIFANLSQPKCNNGHTDIRVQRVGCLEEDYSRREDEEAEHEIVVSGTFYLNMSSCMPERGHFSVITSITLRQSKSLLLIILSVVAALLVIFVIVLVVVCVVIKKKKKRLNHEVSIYNPNGTSFLPGQTNFPKTREDNESHVYASIEDSLVYTHLLRKGMEIGVYGETDAYRSFTGHTESQKPLVSKGHRDDMEVGVYQTYRNSNQQAPPLPERPPSQPLVDNEIYQTEDINGGEHSPDLGLRLEPEGGN